MALGWRRVAPERCRIRPIAAPAGIAAVQTDSRVEQDNEVYTIELSSVTRNGAL